MNSLNMRFTPEVMFYLLLLIVALALTVEAAGVIYSASFARYVFCD